MARFEFSIKANTTESNWVLVNPNGLTKLMLLETNSGTPETTLTSKIRRKNGETERPVSGWSLNVNGVQAFPADQMAPLASCVGQEWQLVLGTAPSEDIDFLLTVT